MGKSDKTTVAQRVEEVLRLRLDSFQFHDILQYASEKGWALTERQVRTYIAKADALLVERLDKKRKPVIARHLAQRQALLRKAIEKGEIRTALAILDSEAKLRGLFPEKELKALLAMLAEQDARLEGLENGPSASGSNVPPHSPPASKPAT